MNQKQRFKMYITMGIENAKIIERAIACDNIDEKILQDVIRCREDLLTLSKFDGAYGVRNGEIASRLKAAKFCYDKIMLYYKKIAPLK